MSNTFEIVKDIIKKELSENPKNKIAPIRNFLFMLYLFFVGLISQRLFDLLTNTAISNILCVIGAIGCVVIIIIFLNMNNNKRKKEKKSLREKLVSSVNKLVIELEKVKITSTEAVDLLILEVDTDFRHRQSEKAKFFGIIVTGLVSPFIVSVINNIMRMLFENIATIIQPEYLIVYSFIIVMGIILVIGVLIIFTNLKNSMYLNELVTIRNYLYDIKYYMLSNNDENDTEKDKKKTGISLNWIWN